jgi:cobaltochelatase CobT
VAEILERRQQHIEELCAAAIRALSGQRDLHFRGGRLHRGNFRLPDFAPHLHPSLESDDFASFRGAADGLALRLAHSDAALHRCHVPQGRTARMLFELLEQLRVESLVPAHLAGVRRNLQHRFDAWSMAFVGSGLTETHSGIVLYTLAQMARARILGGAVAQHSEEMIESTRCRLLALIAHDLAGLRRHRADQAAYAPHARAIAERIDDLLGALDDDEALGDGDDARNNPMRFSLRMDVDGQDEASAPVADAERSLAFEGAEGGYRVFSTAYDREHAAASLVRAEVLREYRDKLDRLIAERGLNAMRLARQLKAVLAWPQHEGWEGAREEGRIDGARLAQLISTPAERRLFRAERIEPVADAVVSLLIDCSGSMRQHIERVAMLVDLLSRALEIAGVGSEVLGFSTGAWHGGRAARDWQRAGRPRHPGRLNERCHLVFKDADTPWRRARPSIAALFKADLFREGFDGEAVDWAVERLRQRDEARRMLIVFSDGCPMDSATMQANDDGYLGQHLLQVVQRHEAEGEVQIFGVGVGLDLSVFYRRCQAIDLSQGLRHETLDEIVALIAGRARR